MGSQGSKKGTNHDLAFGRPRFEHREGATWRLPGWIHAHKRNQAVTSSDPPRCRASRWRQLQLQLDRMLLVTVRVTPIDKTLVRQGGAFETVTCGNVSDVSLSTRHGRQAANCAKYQARTASPQNRLITAPAARKGPKGRGSLRPFLPVARRVAARGPPIRTDRRILNRTSFHPRKAPSIAPSLTSPMPMPG